MGTPSVPLGLPEAEQGEAWRSRTASPRGYHEACFHAFFPMPIISRSDLAFGSLTTHTLHLPLSLLTPTYITLYPYHGDHPHSFPFLVFLFFFFFLIASGSTLTSTLFSLFQVPESSEPEPVPCSLLVPFMAPPVSL